MKPYQVGVYYFPGFHAEGRNDAAHGAGWSEWELVKRAEPKYPGHQQPKVPLWGYEDEGEVPAMTRKIAAAADHGVNHFIFDWYWYDGPYLNRPLDEGFLGAPNNDRLQFALMWANHDWIDIHPAKRNGSHKLLFPGAVDRATFDAIVDYVIERYFKHPSYWKIDGCPYFSFYESMTLIAGLGGIAATREAFDSFRAKTRAAGFPDLHLNAVVWGRQILPNEQAITEPRQLLAALGVDSVASYVWIHHVALPHFPTTSYDYVMREAIRHWQHSAGAYDLPFHPNVTMGWDASPRTVQADVYGNTGYPFMPMLEGNTPQRFEAALREVKAFLDAHPATPPIFSINAWNEWTEGSYLEPDMVNGMGYLEAIRNVFAG